MRNLRNVLDVLYMVTMVVLPIFVFIWLAKHSNPAIQGMVKTMLDN